MLDDFVAALLVGLHLSEQVENQFHAVQQVFLKCLSFLDAETVDDVQGLVEGLGHFGYKGFVIVLCGHIEDAGHTEENGCHVGGRSHVQGNRNGLNLLFVGLHDVLVDVVGLAQVGVGDGDDHVHLAALQLGSNAVAEVQFSETQLVGQLDL